MARASRWSTMKREFPFDPDDKPTFEYAPADRMYEHPDVLAEFMRRVCRLEPEEYALSDESLLSDLDTIDTDELRVPEILTPTFPEILAH